MAVNKGTTTTTRKAPAASEEVLVATPKATTGTRQAPQTESDPLPGVTTPPIENVPHTVLGYGKAADGLTGLAAIQAMWANAISDDPSTGLLNDFMDGFKSIYEEKLKSDTPPPQLRFIALPAEAWNLPYSGIAITHQSPRGVSVHTLLLEDDGPKPDNQIFRISPQETVEVPTTPGDTYNEAYWKTVNLQVQRAYGSNVEIIDGGMQVVYRTVNPEDRIQVGRILTAAANAAVGAITLETVGGDLASGRSLLDRLNSYGVVMNATVNTNPPALVTPNGLPVRRDLVVTSTVSVPNQNNTNLRGTRGGSWKFAEISAFTTLEYVAPEPVTYVPGYPVPQQPTQRYIPRLVITDISSQGITTLPNLLLAISTATVIQEGLLWTEAFRPQKGRYQTDTSNMHNIGAIGYDIPELRKESKPEKPEPGMIDVTSASFTDQHFYQLMVAAVFPTPIYSIDVEEAGSLSWLTNVFRAAANNDAQAKRAIIEAANSLTNGLFSNYFKGDSIIRNDDNRVFLGTYNPAGQPPDVLRDLRELDYLAILNVAGQTPEIIEDFEKTQRSNGGLLPERLASLHAIYEAVIGNVDIKGYAQRFTFSNAFIESLARATRDAGVAPRFQNLPRQVQDRARQRVQDFEWAMVNHANMGSIYRAGATGGPQLAQMYAPHQWGYNYGTGM